MLDNGYRRGVIIGGMLAWQGRTYFNAETYIHKMREQGYTGLENDAEVSRGIYDGYWANIIELYTPVPHLVELRVMQRSQA